MRNWKKVLVLLVAAMMLFSVAAFAAPKQWVVGFAQLGSESEWRTADTVSVQNAFLDDPSFTLDLLRRSAEAGEPDKGHPLLHREEGQRHSLHGPR